jgi:hypothetical protein
VKHHIAISKDSRGHNAIMQHTSFAIADEGSVHGAGRSSKPDIEGKGGERGSRVIIADEGSCPSPPPGPAATLSILTFNIWHTQAPASVDRTPEKRWELYMSRLRHLASVIVQSDADVVGLQVRQSVDGLRVR